MIDLDREVAEFLSLIRQAWVQGVTVTSWYRDPIKNEEEGGEPDSQHLVGLAVDVVGPGVDLFARRCSDLGMIVVPEIDHLHVQRYPKGALSEAQRMVGADRSPPHEFLRDLDVKAWGLLGGPPDETISAGMGRRIRAGTASLAERALCDLLDLVDPDHCFKSADYFAAGGDGDEDESLEDAPGFHRHRHRRRHPPTREGSCPEEPWWLRCPDPDPDEDD